MAAEIQLPYLVGGIGYAALNAAHNLFHSATQGEPVVLPGYACYEGAPLADATVNIFGSSAAARDSSSVAGADEILKCMVMRDRNFDVRTVVPEQIQAELQAASNLLDGYGADLRGFYEKGGKVLLLHGMADQLVSPYGTIQYYERLHELYGEKALASFLRFYLVPGYGHGAGEMFNMNVDLLAALDAWVCSGTAPARLVATDMNDAEHHRELPLYEYPGYPEYTGSGDIHRAASFRRGTMETVVLTQD